MKNLSPVWKVVLIMVVVVAAGSIITWRHYKKINDGVDPRIVKARELYGSYNAFAAAGDYRGVYALLDSAERIYAGIPHYADSWERAVLWNNRAALYLTVALYADSIPVEANPFPGIDSDSLVALTERSLDMAMNIYQAMGDLYNGSTPEQIREQIRSGFMEGLEGYTLKEKERYLEARAEELHSALAEKDMRMSVCHTNLGIVCRYREDYEGAIGHYQTALLLWDRNLEAENNLNSLLGRPLKKRNILQKLFPPERGSAKSN